MQYKTFLLGGKQPHIEFLGGRGLLGAIRVGRHGKATRLSFWTMLPVAYPLLEICDKERIPDMDQASSPTQKRAIAHL